MYLLQFLGKLEEYLLLILVLQVFLAHPENKKEFSEFSFLPNNNISQKSHSQTGMAADCTLNILLFCFLN